MFFVRELRISFYNSSLCHLDVAIGKEKIKVARVLVLTLEWAFLSV